MTPKPEVTLESLKLGQVVWIDHYGSHPAVVMRTAPAIVICGTGSPYPADRVEVRAGTRYARAMGLTKTTYFYASKVAVVTAAGAIQSICGQCPASVFQSLEPLVAAAPLGATKPADAQPEIIVRRAARDPEPGATS